MPHNTAPDIHAFEHHWQDEADAAFLYRALASVEPDAKKRDVYSRLAQTPDLITRQRAFSLDSPGAGFKAAVLPDLLYQSRRKRYFSS